METRCSDVDSEVAVTPTHEGKHVKYTVEGIDFEVSRRYKPPIEVIGHGSFGIVRSLLDSDTGESVAIKKLRDEFCSKKTTKRTPREIKILRHMDYENVIPITDIIPPPTRESFNNVYIVYKLIFCRMDILQTT
uniref:Protein kinase domain-containing protein n=1 Tax=Physcomitrium patens TaxID=3218 RepID=A0A2K1JT02_PHYPA|nr:hypothetical protein PHYPA_014434 [Physcomitrium patens]